MTQAALAIAQLCYEILLRDRYKAKVACERRVVTEALTNIVEVNTKRRGSRRNHPPLCTNSIKKRVAES
ncbi:hypothetical protein [Aneurinibacillus aneurinilyticus]|nr:hypothetical protein [Aneurinibacillus aneurinilyticus]MCI1696439.1 hypothetical protein [Aneurinibacillus aneurinilyticus]MED0704548.1 hypothetical protein [Aneurinibacillus aneurinilyticus]MED0725240.1 hypothetical protein [Aneurinibacillus aneurinilyticus]MED0734466.1 hypothetical protein [Aneurinibacillus aneurinilyticus]MED0742506.1 hypothetical protein [Aneurinibacillus aneurinilyticus]